MFDSLVEMLHPYLLGNDARQPHYLYNTIEHQQMSLIMTEQKSQKDTLPSLLLSAFSSISFNVSSSKFSLMWLFISLKSSIVRQFLLSRSYFLKIAAISFLVSFRKGLVSIAFMNSMKLIPPASSASYSATISYVVFLLGLKPFWVSCSLMSFGSSTPMPVESQASKTSFRSITSWQVSEPVMQSSGWNCLRSLRLNRTPQSLPRSTLDSDLSGLYPNFCEEFLSSLPLGVLNEDVWFLGSFIDMAVAKISTNQQKLQLLSFPKKIRPLLRETGAAV